MLFNLRVYYADTDAGGVVYHSKYLDFCERARTELLRENGFIQSKMSVGFVVKNAEVEYKKSAKLDDLLTIKTALVENKGVILKLRQEITRDDDLIFTMNVSLVCVNKEFKPVRMPKEILFIK